MSRAEKQGDVEEGHLPWRRSMPGQPPQVESDFGDSSGPLFSIYSTSAEREDNKMAERWQRDALVILIFVSIRSLFPPLRTPTRRTIDWLLFHCRRRIGHRFHPGPQTKCARLFHILSREHLSTSRRPTHSFPPCEATTIPSTDIRHLGELTLVLEHGYQPNLRSLSNIVTSVGSSIHRCHSARTMQSTQASTDPCIFCRRRRNAARELGCRSPADPATSRPLFLSCRSPPFSLQY